MYSKNSEVRQSWTYHEDKLLIELIKLNGCLSWNRIANEFQTQSKNSIKIRSAAACRERYQNILNPNLNRNIWTDEEEQKLFNLQQQYGNCWARIASQMTGRSDLLCKNHFYATLRKVLRRLSKAVGFDQSSDILKSIKPSVLGLIYCNEDSLQILNIDDEMKTEFKKIIKKYRHIDKSEISSLSEEEREQIKEILNKLFTLNNNYIAQKGNIMLNKNQKQDLKSFDTKKQTKLNLSLESNSKIQSKIQTFSLKDDQQEELDQQQNLQTQIFQDQQPYQNLDNYFNSYFQSIPSHLISRNTPLPVQTFFFQPNFNIWPIQTVEQIYYPQFHQIPQTYPQIKFDQLI